MAPKSSSASSGTRKKHARKAAQGQELPEPQHKPAEKKGKKHRSDPPRPKVYIAPIKPTAANPDPLDAVPGLAHRLPPPLLVILRSLGKKAMVTKIRALEELQSGWVAKVGEEDGVALYALKDAAPVWLHHLPAHLVHPARRVRLLTAQVHAALLAAEVLEDAPQLINNVWALAAHDPERAVAAAVVPKSTADVEFLERVILHTDAVYNELNPPAPVLLSHPPDPYASGKSAPGANKGAKHPQAQAAKRPAMPESTRSKTDEQDLESAFDRRARLRIAAFGALRYLLETTPALPLPPFLASPALWSALQNTQDSPALFYDRIAERIPEEEDADADVYTAYLRTEITAPPIAPEDGKEGDDADADALPLGRAQPALRRAAWSVAVAVLSHLSAGDTNAEPQAQRKKPTDRALPLVWAHTLLPALWAEADPGVQMGIGAGTGMWRGGLGVVRAHPEMWALAPAEGGFDAFLTRFLSTACNSTAANTAAAETGYGAVVVVLGGVPWEILAPQLGALFDAFWAALGGASAVENFHASSSAKLATAPDDEVEVQEKEQGATRPRTGSDDCSPRPARACGRRKGGGEDDTRLLAREVKRVWAALGGRVEQGTKEAVEAETKPRLHVDSRRAAQLVRGVLGAAGAVGGDLLTTGLETLGACLRAGGPPALVCAVLEALVGDDSDDASPLSEVIRQEDGEDDDAEPTKPTTKAAAAARIRAYGLTLRLDVLRAAVQSENAALLVKALRDIWGRGGRVGVMLGRLVSLFDYGFTALILNSTLLTQALDALLSRRAYALLLTAPSLLFAYLTHRITRRQQLWRALLQDVAAHPEAAADTLGALVGSEASGVVERLSAVDASAPSSSTTAATAVGPLDALFDGPPPVPIALLARVLQRGELFLSPAAGRATLARVVHALAERVESALTTPDSAGSFDADLQLLASVLAGRPDAADARALLPAIYVFANIWLQWKEEGGEAVRADVVTEVKRRLGVLVCSTDVCVTPEDVLEALAEGTLGAPIDVVSDVFPAKAELDAMLDVLPADPLAPSLAVLHPYLPPASALRPHTRASAHDKRGYAAYARIAAGLLQALAADRRAAKENIWALRHVTALAITAEDVLAAPSAPCAVFDRSVDRSALEAIRARALQLTADDKPLVGGGALPELVVELVRCARRTDGSRECRVLDRVLRHVLQDADKPEADLWMAFARKIEKSAPETCIAIVSAVSASTLEPPRLERYRNELAADLLGIPPSKANTQGLLTLRKLAASAPGLDSDVAFLPQQRSVNIFKACQQWVGSDEDIEEELESAMTLVFFHLAPLLQNVPGTHWDLIFDVVESNLESASLTDDETLVTLARTLRLIILIQDLTLTNKTLRASWEERQTQILTMVRDLAAGQSDDVAGSSPRSACRELVLSIVQDLPTSLITEDTLPKMCHLLADPSVDVQKMTYQLLTVAARKRTEHFVIEAGVDVDAVVKADLPLELLDILQTSLNFNQDDLLDLDESIVFGYLLGWMVVFDLFSDASLKVRLSYIDQLRTLDIIGSSFIPNILSLLGVDQGIPKAFKLDVWNVDEYLVQLYESGSTWSLQVLAAHLYYRALLTVPSLIYNWVLDCKDRQLSSSIATYTSLHFSPVIIRAELAHVKSPEATAELVDDNLTVKVATAVNEVVASYLVDEHQLEIKLRIPSDWPLHKIEVKDVKRVGVEENRWRAWILAVQQTLWSQNGRIVDGLGLFKKNVTLHFEGQVECAICYSIISVMDGTLPKKPCKTCKNRFHSGCLYKASASFFQKILKGADFGVQWFSTSHSSSCPLCRSDII
ncbi:Delta-9 fatty acid desaturase protein [Mycena venus]|uniref:E3 ubiquitin-protein ligase listerin n=1 Tax=Mycena venus TaxID=2733690 RepID=A0A8H6XWV8_9AGAR|nr:Delta-9 fatty acid desaturase protein [Mycena venus]